MKFADRYQQFMKEQKEEVPAIQLSNLKAVMKNCEIKEMHLKYRHTEEDYNCPGDTFVILQALASYMLI